MHTLLLDRTEWDLCLDALGNIALATEPYALAQDAASAIRLFSGELWYDTTQGVPYWAQILGHRPPVALMKDKFNDAAKTVPGVTASRCFITGIDLKTRKVSGQVQITDNTNQTVVAAF